MGCCESSNASRPYRSDATRTDATGTDIPMPTCSVIPEEEIPQEIQEELNNQMEELQADNQWIQKEEQKIQKDDRPGHYRQLLMQVQKMHFYYEQHDIDLAAAAAEKFQNLLKTAQKELQVTEKQVLEELETQTLRWRTEISLEKKASRNKAVEVEQQLANQGNASTSSQQTQDKENAHQVKAYDSELLRKIKRQHRVMLDILKELDRDGWEEQKKEDRIVVYTRREEDDSVSGLLDVDLNVPLQIYLSMVQQASLHNKCMPFTTESREEKTLARNSKIGYVVMDLPVLACRESFFKLTTYCRLHTHGEIVVIQESLQNNKQLQQQINYKPVPNQKYVPITSKYIVYRYRPSKTGSGKLQVAMNPDFGMSFLPMFMKECVLVKLGLGLVQSMKEKCKKFKGSMWEAKIQKDPSCFVFFKTALDAYRKQKRQQTKALPEEPISTEKSI